MSALRFNRITLTIIILISMTIACRFGVRPEPTVQNSKQPTEATQPTVQNSQQPTESTQPTAQINSSSNTQSVSFDIIPYEIKDRPDDFVRPGYKYIDIYLAIKNTGTDWVFFNKLDDLIRPIRLITDREIYDIGKDSTENFLSAPGTTVKGIGNNLFYLEYEIASTLRPVFLQLQYSYIPFDEHGSIINSSRVYSDPITLDLKNPSTLVDVPFSPEMAISTLPFTYELPKGSMIINSANQTPNGTVVDFSITSSDPSHDIHASFTTAALTSDGMIVDYFLGQGIKEDIVGPLQTLNDKLTFYSISTSTKPVYLLLYGIYIEDDSQIVKQIIKIIP